MKRKVSRIGPATLMVSLPSKWVKKHGIKKGDEVEVEEKDKLLIINSKGGRFPEERKVEIDISGLDRTSLMLAIRGAYRIGYDEIRVRFSNQVTEHFRLNQKKNVVSVIHQEVARLVGVEIIEEKENYCVIKDLIHGKSKDFDTALRRVFCLLKDMSTDLVEGAKTENFALIESIEYKHDTITKFISYCLRILSIEGYPDVRKTPIIYHIVASIDRIVDVLKYRARDLLNIKKLSKIVIDICEKIHKSICLYEELFYKFKNETAYELNKNREDTLNMIKKSKKKLDPDDLVFVINMKEILESFWDLELSRMSMID